MKKISFILIMAMISTYTVYAVPWTANNAVEIEPSVMVEISCNDNFSINGDTEPDFKGAYGTAGYRGYSTGYNINIKDAVTQNTGRDTNPLLPVETIDDAHGTIA